MVDFDIDSLDRSSSSESEELSNDKEKSSLDEFDAVSDQALLVIHSGNKKEFPEATQNILKSLKHLEEESLSSDEIASMSSKIGVMSSLLKTKGLGFRFFQKMHSLPSSDDLNRLASTAVFKHIEKQVQGTGRQIQESKALERALRDPTFRETFCAFMSKHEKSIKKHWSCEKVVDRSFSDEMEDLIKLCPKAAKIALSSYLEIPQVHIFARSIIGTGELSTKMTAFFSFIAVESEKDDQFHDKLVSWFVKGTEIRGEVQNSLSKGKLPNSKSFEALSEWKNEGIDGLFEKWMTGANPEEKQVITAGLVESGEYVLPSNTQTASDIFAELVLSQGVSKDSDMEKLENKSSGALNAGRYRDNYYGSSARGELNERAVFRKLPGFKEPLRAFIRGTSLKKTEDTFENVSLVIERQSGKKEEVLFPLLKFKEALTVNFEKASPNEWRMTIAALGAYAVRNSNDNAEAYEAEWEKAIKGEDNK